MSIFLCKCCFQDSNPCPKLPNRCQKQIIQPLNVLIIQDLGLPNVAKRLPARPTWTPGVADGPTHTFVEVVLSLVGYPP